MDNRIDLEKFMRTVSNCPEGILPEGTFPVTSGSLSTIRLITPRIREEIIRRVTSATRPLRTFEFSPEIAEAVYPMVEAWDEAVEGMWSWAAVPTAEVEELYYSSSSGSVVVIVHKDDHFEVSSTDEVGETTARRLRAAGYEGEISLRGVDAFEGMKFAPPNVVDKD